MVEWKKLGEVISVHTGSQLNRNDMLVQGAYPVINGGRNPSGYTIEPNEKSESITISQGGESAGFVNWMDCAFWAGAHCYVVDLLCDVSKRYLFHFLKNSEHELMASKQGAGIPGLNRKSLYKLAIPIPSLAEQTRIVGILDTFTASIENLKQQIAQRRKQYEHYRDQLLDLEGKEGVEMKTLGEVCDFQNGFSFKSELFRNNGLPIIRITNISNNDVQLEDCKFFTIDDYPTTNLSNFEIKKTDILIAMSGATTGKVGMYRYDFNAYLNQRVGKFCPKPCLLNGYVYHYLLSLTNHIYLMAGGGAQPNLSSNRLMKELVISVPSLTEQQSIVSILDTFEASIANLEQQLVQREKQYEYYRNKLLTFE